MPKAQSLSADTLAAIQDADRLFEVCKSLERRQATHEQDVSAARTAATEARAAEIEALTRGDEAAARTQRAKATELEARVAAAPAVAALLKSQWDAAAAAWSRQWHVARQRVEAEVLGPLAEKRVAFEAAEAAAREECARLVGEMRS